MLSLGTGCRSGAVGQGAARRAGRAAMDAGPPPTATRFPAVSPCPTSTRGPCAAWDFVLAEFLDCVYSAELAKWGLATSRERQPLSVASEARMRAG